MIFFWLHKMGIFNLLGSILMMLATCITWKYPVPAFSYGYGGSGVDYQDLVSKVKKKKTLQKISRFGVFIAFLLCSINSIYLIYLMRNQ